jgi:Ca2+-binding RTX toxin-like protein
LLARLPGCVKRFLTISDGQGLLRRNHTIASCEITVNQTTLNGVLVYQVQANSWDAPRAFPAAGVGRILIHMCDGDDHATISSGVDVGAVMFGDAGNDHLNAGKVAAIVIGGDGDDMLIGGSGKDVLIGGRGADRIVGHAGDDLLVAGYTSFEDDDPDDVDAALMALQGFWNTSASYEVRKAAVQSALTVFSDNALDQLTGSAGTDLFFANTIAEVGDDTIKDIITDLKSETAFDIDEE